MIKSSKTLHDYRQELHVSKSQIKTFLMCPQKYCYQYVQGKEWERKSAALPFGSAVHAAIADYYNSLAGDDKPLSVKEIQDSFADAWTLETKGNVPIDYNGNNPDELLDLGKRMIEVFIENVKPRNIEAVELPFSVPIINPKTGEVSPLKLVGAFDLLEADDDGNRIISELKTSARKWTDGQVETELDSAVYSYALKQFDPSSSDETLIRFDVLLKTKKPSMETYFTTKTENDRIKMLSLFFKVLKAIEAGAFFPIHGWQCPGCSFRKQCADDI